MTFKTVITSLLEWKRWLESELTRLPAGTNEFAMGFLWRLMKSFETDALHGDS